jgi:DNA-binding NarL/FixJ family response regulator
MSITAAVPELSASRSKVLFADDHHLLLDALSFMANPHYDVQGVDTIKAFEQAVDEFSPDLAVMDIRMPDGDGFEAARRILLKRPALKLMFLTMHSERTFVKRAMEIGARGYVPKHAPAQEVLSAMQIVLGGGTYVPTTSDLSDHRQPESDVLTDRQKEVLRLIAQGCSAKEIATNLNISVRTAEFHRAAIMDRLRLHSTAMMTRYAVEHGLA